MEPVEQIILGLVIVVAEIVLIGGALLWGLRDQWRGLDNDPEEVEGTG